jgi:hypothetical protein
MKALLLFVVPLGLLNAQMPSAVPSYGPAQRGGARMALGSGAAAASQNAVLPRIFSGANWSTTVVLLNAGTTPVGFQEYFFSAGGRPVSYTLHSETPAADITASAFQGLLAPGAMLTLAVADPGGANPQGWSLITYDTAQAAVHAYAVIRHKGLGSAASFEITEPASALNDYSASVPFDNTQGFESQLTFVNPARNLGAQVRMTYLDSKGNTLLIDVMTIEPGQQQTLAIPNVYPDLANKTGSVQIQADINLFSVTAIRYNASYGVISALPVFGQPSSVQQ